MPIVTFTVRRGLSASEMYAQRAHSHKVEAEGATHAVYISHAKEVAALIEEAAGQT
jgi:hypothetical protein